jgi:hypothetical protein
MSQLTEYIEQQIKYSERMRAEHKKNAECEDENQCVYYQGLCIGLDMGINDMKSILRVANDFERLGLLK